MNDDPQALAEAVRLLSIRVEELSTLLSGSSTRARGCTTALMKEWTWLSGPTISSYARKAGVPTPRRGGRNHRWTDPQAAKILCEIIGGASDEALRRRCRAALLKLGKNHNQITKSK